MPPTPKRIALILPKGHDYATRLIEGVLRALPVKDRSRYQFVEIPYEEDRSPPAVYSIETKLTYPVQETLLPIAKRCLVRYISA